MLFRAQLETSIMPPFDVADVDLLPVRNETPVNGPGNAIAGLPVPSFSKMVLAFAKPKITVSSDYVGTKVFKQYGEPFPWQFGLTVLLLASSLLGFVFWSWVFRRR